MKEGLINNPLFGSPTIHLIGLVALRLQVTLNLLFTERSS